MIKLIEKNIYNSPKAIDCLLAEKGFSFQKKFGQNFLISDDIRKKIVAAADIEPGQSVWEMGPGIGSMTTHIADLLFPSGNVDNSHLTVFEIDRGYVSLLQELFGEKYGDSFKIAEGDMLKTWKKEIELEKQRKPMRIIGNLPYNAAASLIASFIEADVFPEKMVFTIQKEVAQRMIAKEGTKDFSTFTILCAIACKTKIEFDIPPSAFYPAPKVTSSVVSLVPHNLYREIGDRKAFSVFIRTLFNSRRKTILNNLKTFGKEKASAVLAAENISPAIRADNLATDRIVALYNRLKSKEFLDL